MKKVIPLTLFFIVSCASIIFLLPIKQVFLFTETRTNTPERFYVPIKSERKFQIRYVHSIHLSDVIENYEVTKLNKIRLLSMTYEDVAIGLPGHAEKGETLTFENGLYTLSYDEKYLDNFIIYIGTVDADLTFRYLEHEIDLKAYVSKGKSYKFQTTKLSLYQMMKGVNMYGEKK